MKNIPDAISKTSLSFLGLYIYLFLVIVNFSIYDIALILIVDLIAYVIIGLGLDALAFKYFFPVHDNILKNFKSNFFVSLKKNNDHTTLSRVFEIPRLRALFVIPINMLKVLPAGIYFVYFADHKLDTQEAWIIFLSMEFFLITIFSGITYIELHSFVTKFVNNEHKRIDLSTVFKNITIKGNLSQFKNSENLTLFSCSVILIIQTYSLSITNSFTRDISLFLPLFFGIILIAESITYIETTFIVVLKEFLIVLKTLGPVI